MINDYENSQVFQNDVGVCRFALLHNVHRLLKNHFKIKIKYIKRNKFVTNDSLFYSTTAASPSELPDKHSMSSSTREALIFGLPLHSVTAAAAAMLSTMQPRVQPTSRMAQFSTSNMAPGLCLDMKAKTP